MSVNTNFRKLKWMHQRKHAPSWLRGSSSQLRWRWIAFSSYQCSYIPGLSADCLRWTLRSAIFDENSLMTQVKLWIVSTFCVHLSSWSAHGNVGGGTIHFAFISKDDITREWQPVPYLFSLRLAQYIKPASISSILPIRKLTGLTCTPYANSCTHIGSSILDNGRI